MQKVKIIRDFHSTYMKTFPFAPRAAKSKANSGKKKYAPGNWWELTSKHIAVLLRKATDAYGEGNRLAAHISNDERQRLKLLHGTM